MILDDSLEEKRALELCEAGKFEDGLHILQKLADSTTDPGVKGDHLLNQARCLRELGRVEEARAQFEHARRLMLTSDQNRQKLAFYEVDLLLAEGNLRQALENLERLHNDYVRDSDSEEYQLIWQAIELRRGLVASSLSRFEEALPILESALSFDLVQKDGDFYYSLARCYFERNDYERTKQMLQDGFASGYEGKTNLQAHFLLGQAYYNQGGYARALQEFEACEPHATELDIPVKDFFRWLECSCTALNLEDRARYYRNLS